MVITDATTNSNCHLCILKESLTSDGVINEPKMV